MKKIIATLIIAAFSVVCSFAEQKTVTVIVPFDSKGVASDEADIITEYFITEYAATGKATVVDRNSFEKIRAQQNFQNTDWSNAEKVAKLGESLNASQVIVGQLLKFREEIITTIKVVDVNTTEILAGKTERVKDVAQLFDKIPAICNELAESSRKTPLKYKIGDIGPGGGIVFYTSEIAFPVHNGDGTSQMCNFLEVSPIDLGTVPWISATQFSPGTSDGLGAGMINTYNIIKSDTNRSVANNAAYLCNQYYTETTKKNDWYLPSKVELDLIYQNLVFGKTDKYKFNGKWFWSSSGRNGNLSAWGQRFSDGLQNLGSLNYYTKYDTYSVRAVRAF